MIKQFTNLSPRWHQRIFLLVSAALFFSGSCIGLSAQIDASAQITLSAVSPSTGSTTSPTMVLVTGSNLTSNTSFWFGTQQAPIVNYTGPSAVYVMVPAQSAQTVEVVAIANAQRASLGYAFTYRTPPTVTLTSVSPSSGPANASTPVTLQGSNLQSGAQVKVGNSAASSVSVNSASQLTAVLPALSSGSYTVQVTNPNGTSAALANAFSYTSALRILGVPLVTAIIGQPFATTAEATGGTPPYSWSLVSGSLPPGITGTAQGVLSGSPTTVGTYNFTAQVQDSKGATAQGSGTIVTQKAPPANAPAPSGTALTQCQALSSSGSYYLANDVTCTNQGFALNADNITLDLNGHTITYGSPSAVVPAISICDTWYSQLPSSSCGNSHHASPTVKNGTITQASNASPFTHAIWIGQANGTSGGLITGLTININATGTEAIFGDYPGLNWTISNNTINDTVTNIQHSGQIPLSARSQFQGVAIKLDNGDTSGAGDVITGNTINGSPQGGIYDTNQNTQITNNVITLSSYYSNDYGITVLSNGQTVTGNVVNGRGRGIDAESSNFTLNNNTINVHEEANNSEYGGCELRGSDGIRLKNYPGFTPSTGWLIENNIVQVQATYCEAHGLRFSDIGNAVSGTVANNSFTTTGTQGDYALSFSGVYQPAISYQTNSFSGNTCAQIDNDANTDGANTSVQSGQSWSCAVQAIYDNDLTGGGDGTYGQALTLGDQPANSTVLCGQYAEGTIREGNYSKQCHY